MKRALLALSLALGLIGAAQASDTIPLLGAGGKRPSGGVAGYTGPGDITTFTAWYGLRAFSGADRGTHLVNVCNSTGGVDVGCGDLSSDATTGLLVAATISGITCPGANCTIKTWYDRVATNNATQATVAKRAALTASCSGSLPCATFVRANSQCYLGGSTITLAQPYTIDIAAKRTASVTSFGTVLSDGSDTMEIGFFHSADTMYYAISAAIAISVGGTPDNTWHVLQGIFNTSSSTGTIDGVTIATASPGSGGFTGVPVIGDDGGAGACGNDGGYFDGTFVEGGYIAGASSAGVLSTMNSNIHTFWGF